ncbi:MAG: scyllo-inosose 3-dehydrogenase [Acetivibrionales bacterium]|jgi:threonine dehydrogenase-like Zn-dependent dehydrogenase
MKMKALVIDATRAPKPGYVFDDYEKRTGIARDGTKVWKDAEHEVKQVDIPEISPKEVLIKVKACGICGSDVHTYNKDQEGYIGFAWLTKFPNIPGHEFSGTIVEVGKDVKNFKVGDNVTAEEMQYCGECEACRTYHFNQCEYLLEPGSTIPGAIAEYIKVHEKYVWNINEIIDAYGEEDGFQIGALVEPTGISYNGTIIKSGGIKPGQFGAVYGTGPIGLGCVALMRAAGVSKIFAFEINDKRRELAKHFGADYVYNPIELQEQGITSRDVIMEMTHGWGVDLQIECAGKPHTLYPVMDRSVSCGGRIVNIAHSPQNRNIPVNMAELMWKGGSVAGSNGHAGDAIFRNAINVLASKRLDYRKMITGRFNLDNAVDAIIEAKKADGGKIMVVME